MIWAVSGNIRELRLRAQQLAGGAGTAGPDK